MKSLSTLSSYWCCLLASWLCYSVMMLIVLRFNLYEIFPGIAFLGYASVVALQLAAINFSFKRYHYFVVSFSLIVIGAIASLDMIIHKQFMAELWAQQNVIPIQPEHIDGYVQILIILLNIFTGSIAAQSLFYSLNRRDFTEK